MLQVQVRWLHLLVVEEAGMVGEVEAQLLAEMQPRSAHQRP